MKHITFLTLLILITVFSGSISQATQFHVSKKGNDNNNGSISKPFETISAAVKYAFAGDTITVHAGIYREKINPLRGGESDTKRIVYRAAPGEKVEIKGSEVITGWKKIKNGVWKVNLPNSFFGDYNPYQDSINGDWFNDHGWLHHTGEVYLNGKSFYEKETIEKVFNPAGKEMRKNELKDSDYTWYCESDARNTTIWANFHKYNPNKEMVEISVRNTCFYPEKLFINYITIQGFHFSQAATQWAPPTARQVGMIATHWNKGWIIENNIISDSKCSGITLGKEAGSGQNVWSNDRSIDGSIHYIEVVFRTLRLGWNKDTIGSHIVRNNQIFNCEQTGICGSMGAAFSTIENNHIYNIWTKRQFSGAELAGIKFHGAIDVIIKNNRIHHTGRGIWLDWMAQGARVSKNLMYNNDLEDLFFEVNHGPTLVDNNLLLSPVSIRTQSQGMAFVQNLIAGDIYMWPEPNRFTPYHLPHSTAVAGLSTIYSGDDRYYNNIIIGKGTDTIQHNTRYNFGTAGYRAAKLPVWIDGNVYYNGATHYEKEINYLENPDFNPNAHVIEKGSSVYLQINSDDLSLEKHAQLITTQVLGKAKMPKQYFENPDGSPLVIDTDYFGTKRDPENPSVGPFEKPDSGMLNLKVWNVKY